MKNNLNLIKDRYSDEVDSLKEIITVYIKLLPEYFEDLNDWFLRKNWFELSKQAHKMKSPVFIFGDERLHAILIEIENECKNGDILEKEIGLKIDIIKTHLVDSILELKEFEKSL